MNPGEQKAWETIASMDPADICRNAAVSYSAADARYILKTFGLEFAFEVTERLIKGGTDEGELFLKKNAYFYPLSALWYLAGAKDINPTGRLVNPENLRGGDIYFKGSHVLPLSRVADKYGSDREAFVAKGLSLGGEPAAHGDAAFRLYPLPRIPMTAILWLSDDEFPARFDLLFDSTAELQLPLDIIWSLAMMTTLSMF